LLSPRNKKLASNRVHFPVWALRPAPARRKNGGRQNMRGAAALRVFFGFVFALGLALFHPGTARANCATDPTTFNVISQDTGNSYCVLCGVGTVDTILTNRDSQALTNISVTEDLTGSGLEYVPGSVTVVGYTGPPFTLTESISGSSVTFNGLPELAGAPNAANPTVYIVRFSVRAVSSGTDEALVGASRQINASVSFDFLHCDGVTLWPRTTDTTGPDLISLREPIPVLSKDGRNYDANQGGFATTVYGHTNDDIIWRIGIQNIGQAGMEDVTFDDLMTSGNMTVSYACPDPGSANDVALNNGTPSAGSPCVPASNSITTFEVNDPFGNPGGDEPGAYVDVSAGNIAYVYLVGRITSSCSNQTNTVSNLQWGCEVDNPPAGGITTTSTDSGSSTPAAAAATMSTVVDNANLQVTRQITGISGGALGTRGFVTLTINNNSGGTVKDIHLVDTLPANYVVDPTYIPTINPTYAYGATYDGAVDTVTWTNPAGGPGSIGVPPSNAADFLANTAPSFDLTSTTSQDSDSNFSNMIRNGDSIQIRFRIVMINTNYYDKVANLDVFPEDPASTPPSTDPNLVPASTNTVDLTYTDFCSGTATTLPSIVDPVTPNPEDLDVNFNAPLYIITDDPAYPVPITVQLTNNGGDGAANYYTYVSFGEEMTVESWPTGCSLTSNPPPRPVWPIPAGIPPTATVFECTDANPGLGTIGAGATQNLLFTVTKNAAAANDDLTLRADVIGEIRLSDGTPLVYPTPSDSIGSTVNNYSLDGIRSKALGFNLTKALPVNCSEDNPPPLSNNNVIIGEECKFHIESGGWFGFQTPGYTLIAVENITITDQMPTGQGYLGQDYSASTTNTPPSQITTPTIAAPPTLGYGDVSWSFNPTGSPITRRGEWFTANVGTRLMNDALNASALPNQHAALSTNIAVASFDALFDSGGTTTTITVDQNAGVPGYPDIAVRRADNTVTEPNIQVVKEVCNETLYGVGPSCSNWTTLANDGDTNDSYIYRIQLTNELSSGGVQRAPAFDVTVTDTLDPSDQMYVVPLGTDGLNNDGDSATDGGDANGEGTIGDNTVNNGTPATVTFSYTNSTALEQINPGQTVTLYYRVDPDDSVAPLQTLVNSVVATYDTLPGPSGSQGLYSVAPGSNGQADGARVYTTSPVSATIQILPVLTQPKSVIEVSNTPFSGTSPQSVSIGEEIRYQLTTEIPISHLRNFVVRDELPAGIRCAEAPDVDLNRAPYRAAGFSPGGVIKPTCTSTGTNDYVEWDFGDQELTKWSGGRFTFPVSFIARIENTAVTNDGMLIRNGGTYTNATATYVDDSGNTITLSYGNADVRVREPRITLTKAFNAATADAGDALTVTVTATNSGTAAAYNLRVMDNLVGTKMTFINNVSGADPPTTVDTTTLGPNQPIFRWPAGTAIPVGGSISFTFQVRVDDTAEPDEVLSNTIQGAWDSLPGQGTALNSTGQIGPDGSDMGLRNGVIPNAGDPVNDYETTATASVTMASTVFTKVHASDTYEPTGPGTNVRIGDIVRYSLRLTLPEGTTPGVTITDVLPQGLQFEGVASINGDTTAPYTSQTPFTYSPVSPPTVTGNATTGPTTVTWNIGTIVNAGDNIPANNDFVIVYRARVLNAVLPHVNNITLTNTATFGWTPTAGGAPTQIASATSEVLQPNLSVAKTAVPAGGDTIIDANELIDYTVVISNNGTAPAYDTEFRDVIPVGLRNGAATVTTLSITVSDGTTTTTLPNLAPSYDPATGIADWNFDTGTASAYTIPAGGNLTLTYQVQADPDLGAGLVMTNQAQVQYYYSFDNNAVPSDGGVDGVREIYGPSNTDSVTLTSAAPNPLSKTNPADPNVTIGQEFTYTIKVPATPVPVALHDVVVLDDLGASAADLNFVSVTRVAGPGTWTPVNTSGSLTNLRIEDNTNGIDIPAGEQIALAVRVLVMNNTTTNVAGLLFNNTATYLYNQIDNDVSTQQAGGGATTPDMKIVEPEQVTLQKSGPATVQFGVPSTFTLTVQNVDTGNASTAWDMTVVDQLPNPAPGGMCDTAPTNITAAVYPPTGTTPLRTLTEGTDFVTAYAGPSTCTLTYTMQSAAAAIEPGNRLILTYDAVPDNDNTQGENLINIAGATQWFSLDTAGAGATGEIRTYTRPITDGTPGTLDWQDALPFTVDVPVLEFRKTVTNVTTGGSGATASPGDTLHYHITAHNLSSVPLSNVALTDDLERLNTSGTPWFAAGTMTAPVVVGAPGFDASNSSATGGTLGTGLVDVRNITFDPNGGTYDTLTIDFDITLASSIPNGTVVLNQAQIHIPNYTALNSDDPNVNGPDNPVVLGDEDPTQTVIGSAPQLRVEKTSQDLTGDPAVLVSGDTLRYTITVKNIGSEDATNVSLRDAIPANTTYVPNSTTLNGNAVVDPSAGVSAIEGGMLIHAPPPEDTTPGYMRADADPAAGNVATITFDVTINTGVVNGTVISNQGFVNGSSASGATLTEQPSDDPATPTADDPTRDIVGNLPLIDSTKTVQVIDNGGSTPGQVDQGDTLRYTITVTNSGATAATNVVFTDAIPTGTTYTPNTTTLNGAPVVDPSPGVSAIEGGLQLGTGGTLAVGETATIVFEVTVNTGVTAGTVISNQGTVTSNEQAPEPTDADGDDSNGDQPTQVVVGNAQQLSMTKSVAVVGGGVAQAGGELEYTITITNIGTVDATNVVLTDPIPANSTYVANSTFENTLPVGQPDGGVSPLVAGIPVSSSDLTPPLPSAGNGTISVGGTATVRFRVQIGAAVAIGTTISNTAQVSWNSGAQIASASVDVGGTPGVANLNGRVWHDANFNNATDASELRLQNWSVDIYRNGSLLDTVTTDGNGDYAINGLAPNDVSGDQYELRFRAPGAVATTASLGLADSVFTNGPQRISSIIAGSGANLQNLNLPIDPDGVVYDSVSRIPVAGATLTLINSGTGLAVDPNCFDDAAQQNQVTLASGYYKFDLNFSVPASCPAGGTYEIQVAPPGAGYSGTPSAIIPPTPGPFSVPICTPNAAGAPAGYCEAQTSEFAPAPSSPGTPYYLSLILGTPTPGASQMFNNHIPLDPVITGTGVTITKTTPLTNVHRGDLVPYTITVNNNLGGVLTSNSIVDTIPPGFKYVSGSASINGVNTAPVIVGRQLTWSGLTLTPGSPTVVKLILIIGSGVGDGKYVNQAQVDNTILGPNISGIASATVRVIPDPTFDCTDVIGKVYDDRNHNGYPDPGEPGIAGARVTTVNGLLITTDAHGRFHVSCAAVPNPDRGSNLVVKLDPRSLPTGYRITSENPRVVRATRGKMVKINFGATIHHVVRLDISDAAFVPVRTQLRPEWKASLDTVLEQLRKRPSVLRIAYLGDTETAALARARIKALSAIIEKRWKSAGAPYTLSIETELFWRRGRAGGGS
jgi:uncharacterized repeat protein (TIGR01451 family)/fimbrial isopeptide formation D2 family protein